MELAPEKHGGFLDVACSSDPSLRSEVQSLLSTDGKSRLHARSGMTPKSISVVFTNEEFPSESQWQAGSSPNSFWTTALSLVSMDTCKWSFGTQR